jgi:hypothetical protein
VGTKRLSYFYWYVHWDFEKVLQALSRHYAVSYCGDDTTRLTLIREAYRRHNGLRTLDTDVHSASLRQSFKELTEKGIVPECVMREAYEYACVRRMSGFDLVDLVAPPPYACNWENPARADVTMGTLQVPAYAT